MAPAPSRGPAWSPRVLSGRLSMPAGQAKTCRGERTAEAACLGPAPGAESHLERAWRRSP